MVKRGRPPRMNNANTPEIVEDRSRSNFVKEPERTARATDTRSRDDAVEADFDYDNFDYANFDPRKYNLNAPPARVDEKFGKMKQRWVAYKANNGSFFQKAKKMGYVIRDIETVPLSFRNHTEKWENKEAITVAGELILMEVPEFHWLKLQKLKHQSNNQIIMDIKNKHGEVTRVDGNEVQVLKDSGAGTFHRTQNVSTGGNSESISFDD